jgi:phosphatidylserine/phosphatidylglycerophosphate/cardiolipin synthase-like enzyme
VDVIYFQIAVVATIVGAYQIATLRGWERSKARKAAAVVMGLWLLWTVQMVFWAPLFIIQIGVAIGTLAVVWKMSRQKKQLASLKSELGQALDGFPKEIIENVSQHAWKSNRIEAITGDRHFEALVEAIEEARLRLIIMSGWVTNYVVDEDMEQRLRAALARGVDVFVGFGWTSTHIPQKSRPENQDGYKRLQAISAWANSSASGQLRIRVFPNHAKLVVCDGNYFMSGSHNWLSNRHGQNFELSHKISDPEAVKQTADVAIAKFLE